MSKKKTTKLIVFTAVSILILGGVVLSLDFASAQTNRYPVADAGPDKEIYEDQEVTLEGSGSDPDGDPIDYYWTCIGGELSERDIARPIFISPYVNQDTYFTCTLRVTDNGGLSDYDDMRVLVLDRMPPVCRRTDSSCSDFDGYISLGETRSDCLNTNDWRYYKISGSAGKRINVRVTWSGTDCNKNDLYIYNSDCSELDSEQSDRWTKVWDGISSTGIIVGLDGDSRNEHCQWTVETMRVSGGPIINESDLDVETSLKNLSQGDTIWHDAQNANPGDRLLFRIIVKAIGDTKSGNITVRDVLPSNIIYQGNLRINNLSDSRNIITGINLGDLWSGQMKTITFEVNVAPENRFSYGMTNLVNAVTVYSNQDSDTDSSRVMVIKRGVAGVTTIVTGLTDNIFLDSFLLPLLISVLLIWLLKSRILNFGRWTDLRKEGYQDYKSKKLLQLKIAQIRAKEFIKKKVS